MSEVETVEKVNKSKSYLMPLIGDYINFKFLTNIVNTYIIDKGGNDLFIIKYLKSTETDFIEYHKYLIKTDLFIEVEEVDLYLIYYFNIPDRYKHEFRLFREGRYSEFAEAAKRNILHYLDKNYRNSIETVRIIKAILYREEEFRKNLSKELNMYIPNNYELSSIMLVNDETVK